MKADETTKSSSSARNDSPTSKNVMAALKWDIERMRMQIGIGAAILLIVVATLVYLSHRASMDPIDFTVLFISIGSCGGIVFFLIDPQAKQKFVWRKIINVSGAAATGFGLMLIAQWMASYPPSSARKSEAQSVVLLDSPLPINVYDSDRQRFGGTNSDEIKGVLATIPNLMISAERVIPAWSDEQKLLSFPPRLIVMHYSSFRNASDSNDPEKRLMAFLRTMAASPNTRFVIYSRQFSGNEREQLRAKFEAVDTRLKGRIVVFPVLSGSFMDPNVADELRGLVRQMLKSINLN
jgi:hypothetical protein